MKTIVLLFLCFASFVRSQSPGETAQLDQEREQAIRERAARCVVAIREAAALPPKEATFAYGDVLELLAGWDRPDCQAPYREAQAKLLGIPGHARYYRDLIEAEKVRFRAGEITFSSWQRFLMNTFNELANIPSEDTVEMLIDYANDHFANPMNPLPEDRNIPGLKFELNSDFGYTTVAVEGCAVLKQLGIRNEDGRPVPNHGRAWREWWQDVRAGKVRYRFRGSDVLHPVDPPPGAPREDRRPDRHSGASSPDVDPAVSPGTLSTTEERAGPVLWPYFAGVASLLVALAYPVWKRQQGSRNL